MQPRILLRTEQRKRSDPSAKLYSEMWSLNRQVSDNGKQVYRGQGKNRRDRLTANNIQRALTKEVIRKHEQ